MRRLAFVAAFSAAGLLVPSIAGACSAPVCWPGSLFPETGADVPANTPGFYWRPIRDNVGGGVPDPSQVKLTAGTAPETALAMTATALADGGYLLVPDQPLTPQTTYFLVDQSTCGGTTAGPSVSFTTTAATATANYLGELHTREAFLGPLDVATPSGSCSAEVAAYQVPIELTIWSESIPWRDALMFETIVDGAVWSKSSSITETTTPGGSWQGRAVDLLYRTCHSDDPGAQQGLSAGTHEVSLRARLPGSDVIATSDTITVELWCPGESGDGSGDGNDSDSTGCNATGSRTSTWPLLVVLAALVGRRRVRKVRAR